MAATPAPSNRLGRISHVLSVLLAGDFAALNRKLHNRGSLLRGKNPVDVLGNPLGGDRLTVFPNRGNRSGSKGLIEDTCLARGIGLGAGLSDACLHLAQNLGNLGVSLDLGKLHAELESGLAGDSVLVGHDNLLSAFRLLGIDPLSFPLTCLVSHVWDTLSRGF